MPHPDNDPRQVVPKFIANPLKWKREHQAALLITVGSGAIVGLIQGVRSASPIFGTHDCRTLVAWLLHDVCNQFPHVWFPIIGWPILGGFFGAAVIYIWQLMRA